MRAIAPPAKGSPTVTTTMSVPRALISGLIDIFSMDRIWVGMVSTPQYAHYAEQIRALIGAPRALA